MPARGCRGPRSSTICGSGSGSRRRRTSRSRQPRSIRSAWHRRRPAAPSATRAPATAAPSGRSPPAQWRYARSCRTRSRLPGRRRKRQLIDADEGPHRDRRAAHRDGPDVAAQVIAVCIAAPASLLAERAFSFLVAASGKVRGVRSRTAAPHNPGSAPAGSVRGAPDPACSRSRRQTRPPKNCVAARAGSLGITASRKV